MIDIQHNVQIDVERTIRYTAYDLNARDGSLVEDSATVVCCVVKQSATPEYRNGSAWVTADPGNLAMTRPSTRQRGSTGLLSTGSNSATGLPPADSIVHGRH